MREPRYWALDADLKGDPFTWGPLVYQSRTPTGNEPGKFTLWRHYKGGLYVVLGMTWKDVPDSEVQAESVLYASVQTGDIWVRHLTVWNEEVEVGGMKLPRFRHFSGGE